VCISHSSVDAEKLHQSDAVVFKSLCDMMNASLTLVFFKVFLQKANGVPNNQSV
jgi:hypothetical protein